MIESELDRVRSGACPAEGLANTAADPLLDRALALAFSPAVRVGDRSRPGPGQSLPLPRVVRDRYRIIEPIARGGQGIIVRVRDTNLGRELALKTIHADLAGEGPARARLEAEARVLAALEHPGIPPVHERGYLPDGRPFFTMRLVRGRTLAELVAQS